MKTGPVRDRVLAILGYHKIGEPSPGGWETWYYVPEEEFVDHLLHLRENGWQVIDMQAFLRGLHEPESLPERAALITFDDGYRSTHDVALPLLRRFGYPAVVFVPADYVGQDSHAFDANSREPNEPLCGWNELRALQRQGMAVQSHGASHRAASELTVGALREELERSKAVLEAELQTAIDVFAFPYGDAGTDPSATAELLEHAGYAAACLYDGHVNAVPVVARYAVSRLWLGRGSDLPAMLANEDGRG